MFKQLLILVVEGSSSALEKLEHPFIFLESHEMSSHLLKKRKEQSIHGIRLIYYSVWCCNKYLLLRPIRH